MERSTERASPADASVGGIAAEHPAGASEVAPPAGWSLRTKAVLVLGAVGIIPFAVASSVLVRAYGDALRDNEQRMQLLVLREVASGVARDVERVASDGEAIAHAIAEGLDGSDDDALAVAKAILRSRPSLVGFRLEVPSAQQSVPVAKAGHDPEALPRSTPAARKQADEEGTALELGDEHGGMFVVLIPQSSSRDGKARAPGYVVVPVWYGSLREDMASSAQRNHIADPQTSIVLTDRRRRTITSFQEPRVTSGVDSGELPFWSMLEVPAVDSGPATSFGVAGSFEDGGEARLGTIQVLAPSGWRLAISRPERLALAGYHQARTGALVALGALAVACLAIAFGLARAVAAPVLRIAELARRIGARDWSVRSELPKRGDELGELSGAIGRMAVDLERGEREIRRETALRADLSRFLGQDFVEAIVRGEQSVDLGGGRATVTVLFADVVGFTPLAERSPPEDCVALLNELFALLSEVVFRHGGTVDKFMGDCIMAVFGAPVPCDDHADRALRAAEEMQSFVEAASGAWQVKLGRGIELGIGVNTGEVLVGNIGSRKRMDYTVIGDAVNVAARLEGLAAPGQILVGEPTWALASRKSRLTEVGTRKLAGRGDPIAVYELSWG
jgi:adenylate cyclase